MAKQSKKQIKAQVINEVQRSYQHKIESYEERIKRLSDMFQKEQNSNRELRLKCSKLESTNTELSEKVSQYEEWIERMQDFCSARKPLQHISTKSSRKPRLMRLSVIWNECTVHLR